MPSPRIPAAVLLGLLVLTPAARAGLYYSGETIAELPSQWRGYLLDQRLLRNLAVKPTGSAKPSPGRTHYEEEAAKLEKLARQRNLTADEAADLGAIYVRHGDVARAIEVLRPAQRDNPQHFRLAANLGTAWQLHGDLEQAATCLRVAVRLAPGKYQKAEELHLKLVRLRLKEDKNARDLDDLFGVKYVGAGGKYEPGKLAAEQRKALPGDAAALVQQLALWLPADGRLLWQLAELSAVHGDVATAAAILDGCVTEFNMRGDELRAHRQAMRAEADARAARADKTTPAEHEGSAGPLKPKSSRPLVTKLDQVPLPGIDPKGVNAMPWSVVTETTLDRQFKPTFTKYLKELDGKQVQLTGYMQPLGDDVECTAFMLIEYPVGCWYCEQPDMVGIVFVELPENKSHSASRGQIRVTGKLVLNATDPENFLYTIRDAKVEEME
jgi:tetratricopeptide (TPR) repeat protein